MNAWEKLSGWARGGEKPPTTVAAEARSHMGYVRAVNEDCFLSRSELGLWAVADGMGGHTDGVAAASIVISALDDVAESGYPLSDKCVRQALQKSNQMICGWERQGRVSGATIVAARQDGNEMVIYWAGDSRAYQVSGGVVQLVTTDHSVVQELVDAGAISAREAKDHPQSHVITRAIGVKPQVDVDSVRVPFQPRDLILLCSDGLSRSLTVGDLTIPSQSLARSADALLGNALRRDGSDNATLVLIERLA